MWSGQDLTRWSTYYIYTQVVYSPGYMQVVLVASIIPLGQAQEKPDCSIALSRHRWLQLPLLPAQGFGAERMNKLNCLLNNSTFSVYNLVYTVIIIMLKFALRCNIHEYERDNVTDVFVWSLWLSISLWWTLEGAKPKLIANRSKSWTDWCSQCIVWSSPECDDVYLPQ